MIADVLADLAARPPTTWRAELAARFPDDPGLVAQALMWLHAMRAQAPATPSVLGDRYELGAKIDAGATAEVWRAYDRRLDRNVAIKLFRMDRSPALSEILGEARAASDLISDHVVRVFDVHDDEPPYIVMELIAEHDPATGVLAPGASAAARRPETIREAAAWLRDIARGVDDAHLRNVFHRDLKPHNVLVAPVSRRARIADFGLAVGATGTHIRVLGTPEYIAPEQARGLPARLSPNDADERATLVALDVWGLGAVGYDLVAQRAPWRAEGDLEAWEVAAAATATPVLPGGVPVRLGKVIAKALAMRPADRYATAGAFALEIDRYLAHRPTSLDRSPATRAALWTRRNPQLAVTALLAAVLATMSVAAYTTTLEVRAQRNQLAIDMARSRADNATLADRARATRAELEQTEADLVIESASLRAAKADYDVIVAAKERALAHADVLTNTLASRLAAMREDEQTAEHVRDMYEAFWTRAREEAATATAARDTALHERDAVRTERDELARKLEAAQGARAHAEEELAAAVAARDRAEQARRRAEIDAAKLASDLVPPPTPACPRTARPRASRRAGRWPSRPRPAPAAPARW